MRKIYSIFIFSLFLVFSFESNAQCDELTNACAKNFGNDFISDGQAYKSYLAGDQQAEYRTTFFEGITYRITGCSGSTDQSLLFEIYDLERNLLYSNKNFNNAAYWDLEIKNTIDCIIVTSLDPTKIDSGCGVLLIGFKRKKK
jgi:hypothetical protein